MGLISWIKSKYYDHKLNNADSQLAKGNIEKAEEIFRSILGKQNDAVIHLANLYVVNSESKELKIRRLHDIEDLKEFVDEFNSSDYQKELNSHVSNIYHLAQQVFNSKDYSGAVSLFNSIRKYRGDQSEYQDREHRYKAYLYFYNSQTQSDYSSELSNCTKELGLIKSSKESDIRNIQQQLLSQKRFVRTIYLLLPFKSLSSDFKNSIIDCILQIISNNDCEIKNPKKISDICTDSEIALLAAHESASKAALLSSKSRYAEAVCFDTYAAEFLSNDNKFNNSRCTHILEEASSRANHEEISNLFTLATQLNLSESQISTLKDRTLQIASCADILKGISICRLFKGEKQFDKLYVKLSSKASKNGFSSELNTTELREVIGRISTSETLSENLALFVDYIPAFQKEFFEIVNNLYDNGNPEKAYKVCAKIEKSYSSWISLFIQLRNKDIAKTTGVVLSIKLYDNTFLKLKQVCPHLDEIKDSHYSDFWGKYIDIIIKKSASQPKEKAISSLCSIREDFAITAKSIASFRTNLDEMTGKIAKLRWQLAVELEEDSVFDKAIAQYDALRAENDASYVNRAKLRSLICNLKSNTVNVDIEETIKESLELKSFQALRDDLAYRYALYLLKSTRPAEAESILNKYLPDESTLLAICNNIFVKEAEDRLSEFNNKLVAIDNGTLTTEEAIQFYQSFDSVVKLITSRLSDTKSKFPSYKSKIEGYILLRLFNEEMYSDAFDKIRILFPNFIDNNKAFRNIAIASLGLLENGETDDKKIKLAISIWLSAVFTDKLFVESLDYTSWDDQYTFTLRNSLGDSHEYDYEELPDNVNYDEPIENQNIAIKDVQNSLLTRVETIVREKYSSYESFYNNEKSALEGIIKLNLDEDFILASPYIAKSLKSVFESVSHALDYDYDQNYDNNEDVLNIGVIYGLKGEAYLDYSATKQMAENCCSSLKGSLQSQRVAFSNISRIRDFDKLYSTVKATVSTAMNDAVKNKVNYNTFLDQYETICKAMNETALSMSCANYVNGEIIHRLNDDTIQERDGVSYLVRIYNLAPSNIQIKQNLEAVLCSLARQCEESNNFMDVQALNSALRNTGGKFNTAVEDARIQGKLNAIVDKVNNNKMKNDAALKAVHELYVKCPNNDRVCENLVTICNICIHQYIIGDGYSSSVGSILNKINNTKSATFKKHAKKLAKEYIEIWRQLPSDTQMLMSGMGVLTGKTLNSKGLALKSGLEYLQKLGDAPDRTTSGILGGILGDRRGLFDDNPPF